MTGVICWPSGGFKRLNRIEAFLTISDLVSDGSILPCLALHKHTSCIVPIGLISLRPPVIPGQYQQAHGKYDISQDFTSPCSG